ncbi:MAG: glycoside hydrolase family 95 protein [Bacteroidales bacterium]|nr:glycoside hydrolase family 95 protein [Bacteroidales bacterium]
MKKITMFLASLFITMGVLAQIDTSKEYRLKDSSTGYYLNAANHDEHASGTHGGVNVAPYAESDEQIFTFEQSGSGYYLKTKSGYYIFCQSWNVDALSKKSLLTFSDAGNGMYYILNGSNYFKVEYVANGSGYYPFGDAALSAAAKWVLEPTVSGPVTYTVDILGTTDAAAAVTYNGTSYADGATFETEDAIKKSDFTPAEISGMTPVVSIDGTTIYVSYFDANTQFYTIRNGLGGYVSLNSEYMSNGYMTLTNTNTPQDNKGLWAFVEQSTGVYKVYNYSTGLSKVLGISGSEANARAAMVDPNSTSYSISFSGQFDFDGSDPSYIKINGSSSNYWNKRGDYFALWNSSGAIGDNGSKFILLPMEAADYPDEYFYEVSDIEGVSTYLPKNPNTLWYTTSAEAAGVSYPWMEYALPLGNGELGCMVFGGVHNEELQFNEKTLWSGAANVVGAGSGSRTYMNFGSLFITNLNKGIWDGVTDYVRYLDIEEGIAGVEYKNANGTKFIRKFLSSAPDQVIAGQYTIEGDEKLDLLFKLEPGTGIGAGTVTYADGTAVFTGAMTAVNYAARLHVVVDNGATVTSSARGITVNDATEVTFYLKGATNFNGDMDVYDNYFTSESPAEVDARVKTEIEQAAAKGYAAVEEAHIADFTAITKRMTFDLGLQTPAVDTKTLVDNYYPNNPNANSTQNDHLFLEQLYFHYGRYLAISSNRKPIAAPNNLQGIWNDRGADSPWNSDIHTNINIQMNYWPTEITNLSDLHKPFVNFIIRGAQSAGWKKVGKTYNDGYGWSVLTESSLYNSMSTWGDNYLVANVWYTSHLWTHYRYTQDKDFLKKAFPVMWSAAEFWFHRLIEDRTVYDGTFVAPNEYSAEQPLQSEDGTAHAQQMISYLFENISEAIEILGASELGLSAADVAKLNTYLENTDKGLHTETYTGSWGSTFNGVKTGDELLREWKYSTYTAGERNHRHMSHLMALFPMDQITPESEYFVPAVNALKHRGDAATGWSMGWKVNLWARAQDGDHAHLIIKNALKHSTTYGTDQSQGGIYYNLFDSHAPFQIDGNFGVCSGIAEMLMQSAHGYINIMPAIPTAWESKGTVKGMKAIGNFTVDFNWLDGKCQSASIVSNAGAELRVACKRGAMELAKASIKVNGSEVEVAVDEHGIVSIPCAKDDVIDIDFTTETAIEAVVADGKANAAGSAIYDLSGRRVSEKAGGIYIQDGVKTYNK